MYRGIGRIKWAFSYLPYLGLIEPPPKRPNGISLVVRSCNDEWIEYSLTSIKDFADEVIVVDASNDDTPNIIQKVAHENGLNLKLIHLSIPMDSEMGDTETHVYHSNLGLRYARYRWIVVWDGDHIAFTSGPNNIRKLREALLNMNKEKYHQVHVSFIDLHGDFFHTVRGGIHLRLESFAFTWSPKLEFYDAGRFERMDFPLYYERRLLPNIHVVHLASVKNAKNLLYRLYWTPWRELRDFVRFPTVQSYVKHRLETDFGTSSESEGIKRAFGELAPRLQKCDYLLTDCPEVLRNELTEPRYRILYENGRIVGRNDIGTVL